MDIGLFKIIWQIVWPIIVGGTITIVGGLCMLNYSSKLQALLYLFILGCGISIFLYGVWKIMTCI